MRISRIDDLKRTEKARIKNICDVGYKNRFKNMWKGLNSLCENNMEEMLVAPYLIGKGIIYSDPTRRRIMSGKKIL